MIAQAIKPRFPDGYWPESMDAAATYRSLDGFSKAIYPIWRGIEKKDTEAELKLSQAQVNAKGQLLYEIGTLHRQDIAIHESGIKPHRSDVNFEKMSQLRQKAAKAAGTRTTYQD